MARLFDWIDLYKAARRLAVLWSIPLTLAEEAVHNAVESGDVLVRGIRDGGSFLAPEIAQERPLLYDLSLASKPPWRSLEINWPELHDYTPKVMPSSVSPKRSARA